MRFLLEAFLFYVIRNVYNSGKLKKQNMELQVKISYKAYTYLEEASESKGLRRLSFIDFIIIEF